jgi:hypothetical protein
MVCCSLIHHHLQLAHHSFLGIIIIHPHFHFHPHPHLHHPNQFTYHLLIILSILLKNLFYIKKKISNFEQSFYFFKLYAIKNNFLY